LWFDHGRAEARPRSPALAFGSHCSVFKERRGTRRGRRCRVPEVSRPTWGWSCYRC